MAVPIFVFPFMYAGDIDWYFFLEALWLPGTPRFVFLFDESEKKGNRDTASLSGRDGWWPISSLLVS